MRAMSLCSDEAENDQNEFRDLKVSLESTKGLVESLSKQLFDLKDQVGAAFLFIKLRVNCCWRLT